ncbi:MAG TPA: hypothetical protein VIM73_04685 [Polyangiaceae bacterium]
MLRRTFIHSGWQFSAKSWSNSPGKLGFSALEWLPAKVPGHVHLDLVENGVIAHPFDRMHELGCQWVDDADWIYRTSFEFSPDPASPHRILRFEGLDTVCSIWLNGERVAQHDNMFVPLELDVGARLRSGENSLSIEFESATRVGTERRARYLAEEGLPLNLVRFDDRAFVRKAQYMFGWDWGPRLVSAGVCAPVALLEFAARIVDVQCVQEHFDDGSVELAFHSELEGHGTIVHFVEGFSAPLADGQKLRIERPELWWPAGFGEQHLYRVTSVLLPEGATTSSADDRAALDRRSQRVGLRTIRLLREDDRFGQSFEFEVNRRRVWAVGANWIPDSSFPAELSRERVLAQLRRARDMNMNMLRIWGGGSYESDDFYDGCDELGILVWQDFPYACSYYPDDSEARTTAREEARSAVKRLRNRASLALWCGNNENLTMFESKWEDATRHPPRYYGEPIYEQVLPELLAELDPERPYVPTSPWGGSNANSGGIGDQHYWDVWHGRGDWKFYEDSSARFASEFGFAAAPGHAAWRRIAAHTEQPLALPVRDAAARWHDKTAKGYETFIGYVELHYPRASNIEEWTYYSQLNQRDALRHGIEHYRRSEFCKGSLIWQLNDCWPVQSWAVLDSSFGYKAAAYELRRLYAPALASIEVGEDRALLWVVLDNAEHAVEGSALLEARSTLDGRLLRAWEASARVEPGERRIVASGELGEFEPESTIVVARFHGTMTFRLLAEPKDVRLAEPQVSVRMAPAGIEVRTDVPVIDLFLWDEDNRFRPFDNFLTLPAPGTALVRGHGVPSRLAARSLKGRHSVTWE